MGQWRRPGPEGLVGSSRQLVDSRFNGPELAHVLSCGITDTGCTFTHSVADEPMEDDYMLLSRPETSENKS
ncbi:hypothetical protein INR49_000006 [Caranx melampygus]|nr:hypothetical protein INR49_000006 [Caranx melampygus]